MNVKSPLKAMIITGALAVVLTGCFDSSGTEGMNHSKMGPSTTTNEKEHSAQTTVGSTGVIETLRGSEINLTAKASNLEVMPGKVLPVWTFNNSVPGPQIRVKQGDTVKVNLKNELPEPVTIHWHGLPVPNEMDGIPGVTQNAVQPGQSFTYEFKADVPGTYWYHSHQDGVNQVDRGLYGSIIIEPKEDQVDRDYTLVLDEWMSSGSAGMNMSGTDHSNMPGMDHSNMNMDEKSGNDPHGRSSGGHDMSMYDLFTINGKSGDAVEQLKVKQGEKVRIRLIHAGFMSHTMHLHGQEFKITATDGQPIQQPAVIKDQLIAIAPGERYDIEFEAVNPGRWYIEEHGKDERVKGMKAVIQYEGFDTAKVEANDSAELPLVDMTKYGEAAQMKFTLDQAYDLEYTMDLGTAQKDGSEVFTINGKTYPDTETVQVKKGDLVKVRMVNTSKTDDHPMHLHGHFFQVLSKNGSPLEGSPLVKDTLNLKPGEEYVVAFEADNPGDWMFHCHDLHHAAAGMVTHLLYSDFTRNFVPDPNAGNKPE